MPEAATQPGAPKLTRYRDWLRDARELDFSDYASMWEWSACDISAFWASVWDYFALASPTE